MLPNISSSGMPEMFVQIITQQSDIPLTDKSAVIGQKNGFKTLKLPNINMSLRACFIFYTSKPNGLIPARLNLANNLLRCLGT